MTPQASGIRKKGELSPDNREQEHTLAVYGETGKVAMNDGHTDMLSVLLAASGGRALAAIT